MISSASWSRTSSRRNDRRAAALIGLLATLGAGCGGAAPAGAGGGASEPPRSLAAEALRLELVLRLVGEAPEGELGFRFGPPRDVDGDGISDIAAGARFTNLEWTGMGTAAVWSSADGREIAYWEGHAQDSLFGHSVVIGSDVDGDGHPDVVAAAPNGKYFDVYRG